MAALIRPPRFKWFRSSTVNQWQIRPLTASAKSRTSARDLPFFRSWAHSHTKSPCPREAQRESTTQISASGNSVRSSSAAMEADW